MQDKPKIAFACGFLTEGLQPGDRDLLADKSADTLLLNGRESRYDFEWGDLGAVWKRQSQYGKT